MRPYPYPNYPTPLPEPAPTGDRTLDLLLKALRADPQELTVLMIGDHLEDLWMDGRARMVRAARPDVETVARRLYPGSRIVCVTHYGHEVLEIQTIRGGFVGRVSFLEDHINQRTRLIDPEVRLAVLAETARIILDGFR